MNKNTNIKKALAMLLGFSFIAGTFAGCGFLTNDDEADMKQEVAKVDITKYLESETKFADNAEDFAGIVNGGGVSTKIYKRELISYFLNVGYTYVQSYGYSYEDTINMLMDSLVSRKIVTQYAMAYYLDKGLSASGLNAFKDAELTGLPEKEKELLNANPEVLTIKYFLCEGDAKNTKLYDEAVYTLNKGVNDALDSTEQNNYITAEAEEHNHDTQRTLPTGVGTEKEDYVPANYAIYTGRNVAADCGEYEPVEGSTPTTRIRAYNAFLANLHVNNLISAKEDTSDFTLTNYYYVELSNQLSQALINKLGEDLVEEAHEKLSDNDYKAVKDKYAEMLSAQTMEYTKANGGASAFESALGAVSDTSFVLYGLENYGFVYNVLLPFSAMQNQEYTAAKNRNLGVAGQYAVRAELLEEIEGKDQRGTWFVEHEDENHAYLDGTSWKFFKNNVTDETGKYEALKHYAGNYAFNGTVTTPDKTADGKYETKATSVSISKFMGIMADYVQEVSGLTTTVYDNTAADDIAVTENTYVLNGDYELENDKIADWSQFIRYEGKFNVTNTDPNYFFVETLSNDSVNDSYQVLSAINELMFAYSTDTGCLNTYMGYAVSAVKTSFVSEFEYAAQYAITEYGVGGYVVCPSDYGWHIIYVAAVYEEDGEVYGGFNKEDVGVEGSFSYNFFEALKSSTATQHTTTVQNKILNDSNNDTCVERFQAAYQDLLDLDK